MSGTNAIVPTPTANIKPLGETRPEAGAAAAQTPTATPVDPNPADPAAAKVAGTNLLYATSGSTMLQSPAAAPAPVVSAPAKAKHAETPVDYGERLEVKDFITRMVNEHGYDRATLEKLFASRNRQDTALASLAAPAEGTVPWSKYRKIFLTEDRIAKGAAFWSENKAWVDKAAAQYGVAPEIIVAILGVETTYGKGTGDFPILDVLASIAFFQPDDLPPVASGSKPKDAALITKRKPFFTGELEKYLLLSRSEKFAPTSWKGSYAGAFGMCQFMPSSFFYAVDFDGDGKRDLWSPADAIGSVGNYFRNFAHFGWRTGKPVALPAQVYPSAYEAQLGKSDEPTVPVEPEPPISSSPEKRYAWYGAAIRSVRAQKGLDLGDRADADSLEFVAAADAQKGLLQSAADSSRAAYESLMVTDVDRTFVEQKLERVEGAAQGTSSGQGTEFLGPSLDWVRRAVKDEKFAQFTDASNALSRANGFLVMCQLLGKGKKPSIPLAELKKHVVIPERALSGAKLVSVHLLAGESGPEVWVGLDNFYAITLYNGSPMYALAVDELANEIKKRRV